jgi:hypothetical protein
MDRHAWQLIYQKIREVDRIIPYPNRVWHEYSDVLIVAMYLWSVAWDRPMSWACERTSYNSMFRPRRLPSRSRFSRRVRSRRCQQMLQEVYTRLAATDIHTPLSFLDARPLVVGACSKDPDAKPGRVYGGFARGYKLHAIVSEDRRVPIWGVTPLNVAEVKVAEELIEHFCPHELVLADGNYSSNHLYDVVAKHGGALLTSFPKTTTGKGHRKQSPWRLAAIHAWKGIARYVYRDRILIEGCFGNQSMFGGGLGPLPAWVRTLPRVKRWVGAKLIIYHARLRVRRAVS